MLGKLKELLLVAAIDGKGALTPAAPTPLLATGLRGAPDSPSALQRRARGGRGAAATNTPSRGQQLAAVAPAVAADVPPDLNRW